MILDEKGKMPNIQDLMSLCLSLTWKDNTSVVLPEPYLPFLPEGWSHGPLVLAEAQNLSASSADYVRRLKEGSSEQRIRRLVSDNGDVGVSPWDDGSLKLAFEAAFGKPASEVAVSNAVLWSEIDEMNRNKTPSQSTIDRSSTLWSQMLPHLAPDHIITAGKIAKNVIEEAMFRTSMNIKHTSLRLPSPLALSMVSGFFAESDLLARYPEVNETIERHPEWVEGSYRQNKIFFACHAVSMVRSGE